MRRLAPLLLPLLVAATALAAPGATEKLRAPEPLAGTELPLRVEELPLRPELLRRGPGASEAGGTGGTTPPEVLLLAGLGGTGTWGSASAAASAGVVFPLFDDVVPRSACRAPVLGATGTSALAVCAGLDPRSPRDEHVVLRRGALIERYPLPLAQIAGGPRASLSADGTRFAAVVREGGEATVHLVDLLAGVDRRLEGDWRRPGNPILSADGSTLAFPAELSGDVVAVVTRPLEGSARTAWTSRRGVHIDGLSETGDKLLLRAAPSDRVTLFLADLDRAQSQDLSDTKGEVLAAALHPDGGIAAFTARVGGVCGVFWVEAGARKRRDLFGSDVGCYEGLDLDDGKRFVAYEQVERRSRQVRVHDRRARRDHLALPTGCAEPSISGDGLHVAARCVGIDRPDGLYAFPIPQDASALP